MAERCVTAWLRHPVTLIKPWQGMPVPQKPNRITRRKNAAVFLEQRRALQSLIQNEAPPLGSILGLSPPKAEFPRCGRWRFGNEIGIPILGHYYAKACPWLFREPLQIEIQQQR